MPAKATTTTKTATTKPVAKRTIKKAPTKRATTTTRRRRTPPPTGLAVYKTQILSWLQTNRQKIIQWTLVILLALLVYHTIRGELLQRNEQLEAEVRQNELDEQVILTNREGIEADQAEAEGRVQFNTRNRRAIERQLDNIDNRPPTVRERNTSVDEDYQFLRRIARGRRNGI